MNALQVKKIKEAVDFYDDAQFVSMIGEDSVLVQNGHNGSTWQIPVVIMEGEKIRLETGKAKMVDEPQYAPEPTMESEAESVQELLKNALDADAVDNKEAFAEAVSALKEKIKSSKNLFNKKFPEGSSGSSAEKTNKGSAKRAAMLSEKDGESGGKDVSADKKKKNGDGDNDDADDKKKGKKGKKGKKRHAITESQEKDADSLLATWLPKADLVAQSEAEFMGLGSLFGENGEPVDGFRDDARELVEAYTAKANARKLMIEQSAQHSEYVQALESEFGPEVALHIATVASPRSASFMTDVTKAVVHSKKNYDESLDVRESVARATEIRKEIFGETVDAVDVPEPGKFGSPNQPAFLRFNVGVFDRRSLRFLLEDFNRVIASFKMGTSPDDLQQICEMRNLVDYMYRTNYIDDEMIAGIIENFNSLYGHDSRDIVRDSQVGMGTAVGRYNPNYQAASIKKEAALEGSGENPGGTAMGLSGVLRKHGIDVKEFHKDRAEMGHSKAAKKHTKDKAAYTEVMKACEGAGY